MKTGKVKPAMAKGEKPQLKKHGGNVKRLAERLGIDPGGIMDFSSNINPYGPPESVVEAAKTAISKIDEYPEQEAETFVEAVSGRFGLDAQNIVAGNGTIELIYLIPQVIRPKKALLLVPSFTEYEVALARAEVDVSYKTVFADFRALEALSEAHSGEFDFVILGSPNNPCGYSIKKDALLGLIDDAKQTTWVIDEAFIDFAVDAGENTLVYEAASRDNLVVLRSLTKIYSIPGLRLGYLVANSSFAKQIREAKFPWSVNSIAIAAGAAALKDEFFAERSMMALSSEAVRFSSELDAIEGLSVFIPTANFVFIKIETDITAAVLQEKLLKEGFAIRDCSTYTGLDDRYFRVAVKRPEENDRLLMALNKVLKA